MKFFPFVIIIFLLRLTLLAQVPEWVEIDLQQFIMYDANTFSQFTDFNLTDQEIFNIYTGDYGSLWFETQDYKIKYLPNNLVVYSNKTGGIPILFAPCSYNSINYYSRIQNKDVADKLPGNTWVKYEDPDSYKYVMWVNEKKIVDEKYFTIYDLENYSIPLSSENEISLNEITSSFLNIFIEEWSALEENKEVKSLNKVLTDGTEKLYYREDLKAKSRADQCFDILKDSNCNFWVATGKRLIRFDGNKFYEINIPAITLKCDLENNLWIGTSAYNSVGSLIKFDGCDFTFYNSLNSPLPDNDGILDIEVDDSGNLWIALKRTGFSDHHDNIKLAIYNPNGVKINTDEFLQYIYWLREPIMKDIPSLYSNKSEIKFNVREVKSFSKIELVINNKVIDVINSESEFTEDGDYNISYYFDKPDKYTFNVFLYDLSRKKRESAEYELNYQFNSSGYFLGQNNPNPFSNCSRIEYGFFNGYQMKLKIFDPFMREIAVTEERYIDWIGKPYVFNASKLPNNMYYYCLTENYSGILDNKKMILFNPEKIIFLPH